MAHSVSTMKKAKLRLEQYLALRSAVIQMSFDISKWIYASLLTVNSAGLLALLSNSKTFDQWPAIFSLSAFLIGVLLSFGLGHRTITRSQDLTKFLAHQINIQIAIACDQDIDCNDQDQAKNLEGRLVGIPWLSIFLGWSAALSFVAGIACMALALR